MRHDIVNVKVDLPRCDRSCLGRGNRCVGLFGSRLIRAVKYGGDHGRNVAKFSLQWEDCILEMINDGAGGGVGRDISRDGMRLMV